MTHHNDQPPTAMSYHPSLAELEEVVRQGAAPTAHVQACVDCRIQLEQLHMLQERLADAARVSDRQRLARIEARIARSRAEGAHVLLAHQPVDADTQSSETVPADGISTDTRTPDDSVHLSPRAARGRQLRIRSGLIAASVAVIAALTVLRPSQSAEAGMIAGSMTLSPAVPKLGEKVVVRYTAGALFGRPNVLRLRARVRTAAMESYATGVPVITLATLQKTKGGEYEAQFTLPDSIVFAALAVEDTAATAVDDFGGRTWEVLRGTATRAPSFAALNQRAHDLMGRGWEEGLANVRRMITLYPDTIAAWSWLSTFEIWMSLANDSTRGVHRAQAARLGTLYTERGLLTPEHLGVLFWYTHTIDATRNVQWRSRLLSEAPGNEFAVQERLGEIVSVAMKTEADSLAALDSLDRLWSVAPVNRKTQVTDMALQLVPRVDRHAVLLDRWVDRLIGASPTVPQERTAARLRMSIPALRDKALAQFTRATERSLDPTAYTRALDETAEAFTRRMQRTQALTDAALGQALTSVGRPRDALSVLRRAADAAWDTEVFLALATTSMAAGDTAFAMPHLARVRVDPRTSTKRAATLDTLGRRVLGADAWQATLTTQRAEMSRRVLADATPRVVDDVTLRGTDGSTRTLTQLANGKPLVVVIWSPNCGPAVGALPEIEAMSAALATRGLPTVTIVEQATRDSVLDASVAKAKFTLPVYLDPAGKATAAFNNWGTPQIYIVDGRRRVQFAPTSDVSLARLRAEALLNAKP